MRKVLAILMALALGLTLAYCGDDGDDDGCPDNAECCAAKPCTTGTCINGACVEDPCPNDECCAGKDCPTGETCDNGTCVAEATCCDGQTNYGFIAGPIAMFPPDGTMAQVSYAVVSAMDALTNPNPTHILEGSTGADGLYQTACFDMTNYSLALMILSDDAGYDGAAGTFFPTYSGVMEITTNDDRTCVPEAPASWALPVALVTQLSAVPPLANIATDGFAIVFIVDANEQPVAGAVLKKFGNPPTDLANAIYPAADFSAFDGTETSANGIVIVPGPMGLTNVVAEKTGMTWEEGPIGAVEGFCFTRPLVANE